MKHIWRPVRRLTGSFIEYRDLVTGMGYNAECYPRFDGSFLPVEQWQRDLHSLCLKRV